MFNSSLRQVARTCPNAALAARHTPTTTSKASAAFSTRCHQRRYSSSKPPIPPNNGSASIPTTSVKQVGAPRSTEKRPGAESRSTKRKTAKSDRAEQAKQQELKGNEWTLSLPSVPATQHLTSKDVYIASFFSTHRPLSISGPIPPESSLDDFDKIFQSRPRKSKRNSPQDVIYTLNTAVQNLDDAIQNPQHHDSNVEQRADVIKALVQNNNNVNNGSSAHHLDGQPRNQANIRLVLDLAKHFRPFQTPPAPVAVPDFEFHTNKKTASAEFEAEAQEELQAQQLEAEIEAQDRDLPKRTKRTTRVSSSSLKLGTFFTSHQSPMKDPAGPPRPVAINRLRRRIYADPMRHRRNLRFELISVKRQRRLKMKKHKYKKLMRKTRNLRRRQDKL